MEHDGPTPEAFFEGAPEGLAIFRAVADAIAASGEAEVRVSKSQVASRRRRGFAYVWRPGRYVTSAVPAVLSIALSGRLESPRFKEIAHPAPSTWMHHLELAAPGEVDGEVRAWLREAYGQAG